MEVKQRGHSYILDSVKGIHNQRIDFIKKSNECINHGVPERDGILTQELLRVVIDRLDYLDEIRPCEETLVAGKKVLEALYLLERRAWLRKNQGINGKAEDHSEGRVPFTAGNVLTLPIGPDGHVIPTIPTLQDGVEYRHDHSAIPDGPAAFIDPEERVTIYSKEEGWKEGVQIKDADWTNVHYYKKFEAIDETVEDFGIF